MRKGLLLPGMLIGTFLGMGAGCTPERQDPENWVGTWAAAPQPAMPGTRETYRDQQVRLIVHTSIGGSRVRVRFSNEYGGRPLDIGAARIARRTAGADIDGASERELRFAGQRGVSIAPGKDVQSDPVEFDVPSF